MEGEIGAFAALGQCFAAALDGHIEAAEAAEEEEYLFACDEKAREERDNLNESLGHL